MKLAKLIFVFLAFSLICLEVQAQNSNLPKQIGIINNYGATAFEDGKTIVTEVIYTGLDSNLPAQPELTETSENLLTEKEISTILSERRALIKATDEFSGKKTADAVKIIREWLASYGYNQAEVAALGEKLPGNEMRLTFAVKRGALARVSEIRFEGNVNVPSEELVENFKQSIKDGWQIYDARKYQYFSRKYSRGLLFDKGYFKAKISEPRRRLVGDGYVVTFEVSEGARYRIGNVKVEGTKAFTEKEVLEMLGQKEGDVANGKDLQDFVYEKLKNLYVDKGYVLYNAEFDVEFIEPQVKSLDGIVNIKMTIDEGELFRLGKIEFTGIETAQIAELRNLFSLTDGETFNRSQIEAGIKKINQTGKFYPIKYESLDLQTKIPVETERIEGSSLLRRKDTDEIPENEVDLVIKLKKIE